MRAWLAAAAVLLATFSAVPCLAQLEVFDKTNAQKEIELGREAARFVEKVVGVSEDRAAQERVRRIGARLLAAMPQRAYPYQFRVLRPQEFNAFCLPGGFMYVFEGLLARLQSDDAVAFVMAHEMAHAAHRHYMARLERMKGLTAVALLAGAATGQGDIAALAHDLVYLQYSRDDENDADRTGVEFMWGADFDTEGAVHATKVMIDLEKGSAGGPEYLRSHPGAGSRLRSIEALRGDLAKRARPSLPLPPSRSAPPLPAASAPCTWVPFAPGSRWTYTVSRPGRPHASYDVDVVSAVPTALGSAYHLRLQFTGAGAVEWHAMTSHDGLYRRDRPRDGQSAWRREFVLPSAATPGSVPVVTPCGTFTQVAVVRGGAAGQRWEAWFAEGVGMVRRVGLDTGVVETLTEYRDGRP